MLKVIEKLCNRNKETKYRQHTLQVYPEQRLYFCFDVCVCSVFPKRKECFLSHGRKYLNKTFMRVVDSYREFYENCEGYTVFDKEGEDISKVEQYASKYPASYLISFYNFITMRSGGRLSFRNHIEEKIANEITQICNTKLALIPSYNGTSVPVLRRERLCDECPFGVKPEKSSYYLKCILSSNEIKWNCKLIVKGVRGI